MFHFPSFSRPPNTSLSHLLSLFLSLALTKNNKAQQTQHWDNRVSLLRNHIRLLHSKPPRSYGGEGGGGEWSGGEGRENGVGGYGVECPPRRSHLPSTNLACPTPISLLLFIFFLSSSTPHRSRLRFFFLLLISPEFFFCGCGLIFLAWVVVGFIFVVVGWLWDQNF